MEMMRSVIGVNIGNAVATMNLAWITGRLRK